LDLLGERISNFDSGSAAAPLPAAVGAAGVATVIGISKLTWIAREETTAIGGVLFSVDILACKLLSFIFIKSFQFIFQPNRYQQPQHQQQGIHGQKQGIYGQQIPRPQFIEKLFWLTLVGERILNPDVARLSEARGVAITTTSTGSSSSTIVA